MSDAGPTEGVANAPNTLVTKTPSVLYVGRQPIFDRDLEVHAYELLYRSGNENQADFTDGNQATARVFANTFMELGWDVVTGGYPAFINLTQDVIVGDLTHLFPPEAVVAEVLEDVEPDRDVIDHVASLKEAGYRIALDDFEFHDHLKPLVEMADIVKLDVMQLGLEKIALHVTRLEQFGVTLLAEKIEDENEFYVCRDLGFELFQGYYFAKPQVLKAKANAESQMSMLELLAAVNDPGVTVEELEEIIRRDVSLSYRLLRYINSAAFSLPVAVESVKQALLLLGRKMVRVWVNLVVIAGLAGQASGLLTTALLRARMCETLSRLSGDAEPEKSFTVGMFSTIDSLLGRPMEVILEELPFTEEVEAALTEHQGPLGNTLSIVLAYEAGRWEEIDACGLDGNKVKDAYLEAIQWASGIMSLS